jgi:thioredoxin 1
MLEVSTSNFAAEVLGSEKPVVIDFWAPWCGPCRMVGPVFDELEKEMQDVKFAKVNVDENIDLANQYRVVSIPAFLVFKGGKVIGSSVGFRPKEKMREMIQNAL